ncbi:hypothetical protein NL532_24015 [Mesorhizobium sp. C120A]|uniref:hypothetical protein n=1 Tax=unclassified Mesorhizobium TaxID=325217 RepID=UPI0003CFF29A|nr:MULTISPECIES: hypothetical protein [unclassified Mesorhizobium]ESZ60640.1 hypothetical protein X728_14970 [Mesorhizobium sp. L103C120A0]WJI43675.1 hypothetical protein NL532_24015 [Mesorhizobium sp. C120A]
MIRNANAVDIPAILLLLVECYGRSHYAKAGVVQVDVMHTKKLLLMAIHRHDHQTENGCWIQVIENGGQICGLMLATLARVYVIGDRLMATDVLFVANGFAQPHEAGQLAKNMIQWAKRSPACIEVRCGATAVIEDPERTARLFERLGMKPYGTIHRLEFERAAT